MDTIAIDRRAAAVLAGPVSNPPDAAHIVREGICIQADLGTIGAVEYLKAHDIDSAVIHRVLASDQVRDDDRARLHRQFIEEQLRP